MKSSEALKHECEQEPQDTRWLHIQGRHLEPGGPIVTPMLVTVSACLIQNLTLYPWLVLELTATVLSCPIDHSGLEFAAILFASVSSGLGLQVCAPMPSMSKTVFRSTGPRLVAHIGTISATTGKRSYPRGRFWDPQWKVCFSVPGCINNTSGSRVGEIKFKCHCIQWMEFHGKFLLNQLLTRQFQN